MIIMWTGFVIKCTERKGQIFKYSGRSDRTWQEHDSGNGLKDSREKNRTLRLQACMAGRVVVLITVIK